MAIHGGHQGIADAADERVSALLARLRVVAVEGGLLLSLEHSRLMIGKNSAFPAGTWQSMVVVPVEVGIPTRNQTGPNCPVLQSLGPDQVEG